MDPQLVNLSPLLAARRIADDLLRQLGADYFAQAEPDGPGFRLDAGRLERVVEMGALRAAEECPWLPAAPGDLELCRRHLRHRLVRALAARACRRPARG
ncbi:MAG TPA: hypothetical protein PK668_15090 [Myxococcota bacterium]|nr:hypothetical protein [Myxococcota bacterium]HRY94219.1 hypothetical protein [Myxococcota bacterium]HSA23621.1 hypothetical protein [Myxococcota bacterium]